MNTFSDGPLVTAVLGPTNTGKTHLAMDRMLGHASGMIGFPLRLLARENYDRAVKIKGEKYVALITGEEKIVPPEAKWFLCTVEAMPLDRRVAFIGIDEIQMCADPDRGHVFTERLLHARGMSETMFMGADTAAPLLRALVPGIHLETRPRFSTLSYSGPRKITRLPPRSAIVAFSANDVYAIAELIRRQRGGAAVVLGALSPRTRNAQVALYQEGEVDYLIATDAIGMGLNMDVDHVAFAGTRKFDGRVRRPLTPAELGQIAGRAGRHMNDGTFGTTGDIPAMDEDLVLRIENHEFEPLHHLYWRNSALKFHSVAHLQASLNERPPAPGLFRARAADDEQALAALTANPDLIPLAKGGDAVQLLWDVCRIPDFRKVMSDDHARLLGRIYKHLMEDKKLPEDWIAEHVKRLDRTDGDIDTLSTRIAHIRTWTYVSYHGDWLADANGWQARTRTVEDKLSDALHETLTQRFVDRRTSVLLKQMGSKDDMDAQVGEDGAVDVAGHHVGHIEGFRFHADKTGAGLADKAVANAALKALPAEVARRIEQAEQDDDKQFALSAEGVLSWRDAPVARLEKSADPLKPEVVVMTSDLLEPTQRDRLQARLVTWFDARLDEALEPLLSARKADLKGPARGLSFQLIEGFGSIRRRDALEQIEALSREDRQELRKLGARIGREHLYMPALLKPRAQRLTLLLWAVHKGLDPIPAPPPEGRVSLVRDDSTPKGYYAACGYRILGHLALRLDMVERLAGLAWDASKKGPFAPDETFLSLAGCSHEQLPDILAGLGYMPRKPRPQPAQKHPAAEEKPTQAEPTAIAEPATDGDTAPATEDVPAAEDAAPDAPPPVLYSRARIKPPATARMKDRGKGKDAAKHKQKGGPKGKTPPPKKKKEKPIDPDNPFAKLRELKLG